MPDYKPLIGWCREELAAAESLKNPSLLVAGVWRVGPHGGKIDETQAMLARERETIAQLEIFLRYLEPATP